jgi:hypothetical protein
MICLGCSIIINVNIKRFYHRVNDNGYYRQYLIRNLSFIVKNI